MSNLDRLKRIAKSHIGRFRGRAEREHDDARMILTELGLQMRPEVLEYLTDSSFLREDFLQCLHAAENELGTDLVADHDHIDPKYEPKVYEEDGKVVFSVTRRKEEYVFAEFELPKGL